MYNKTNFIIWQKFRVNPAGTSGPEQDFPAKSPKPAENALKTGYKHKIRPFLGRIGENHITDMPAGPPGAGISAVYSTLSP